MLLLRRQAPGSIAGDEVLRNDAIGFFWEDLPKIKKVSVKEKVEPPPPVWLEPGYLPGLEEALAFNVPIMSHEEIIQARANRETLVFDVESYWNYFCISFRSMETGKAIFFEQTEEKPLQTEAVRWVMQNFLVVGFNSRNYDLPITTLATEGYHNSTLKEATNMLISQGLRGYELMKFYKTKALECDHIDLIEVAPLRANLKIYGGRLHTPKMQDLPFPPNKVLTPDEQRCVLWYNINSDLPATATLYNALRDQINLRIQMTTHTDLRSKSDAQIAEAVIKDEYRKRTREWPKKTFIAPGTVYRYKIPHFLRFASPLLQSVLKRVELTEFEVGNNGRIGMPHTLSKFEVPIGDGVYRMGLGGLHSSEKRTAHHTTDEHILIDKDVTSYYPMIILNLGLYPKHLGPIFLQIYRNIVQNRISAKRAGNKAKADMLKITVNGTFGKLGSKYSFLYSPDLLMQVTLTGQLSLLMLIERIELANIPVVSANTDGIVIKCPRTRVEELNAIVHQWEVDTGFQTEETIYRALYSRDVNNYLAITDSGKLKEKGAFVNPATAFLALWKNSSNTVCLDAVASFLKEGTPVEDTIRATTNITRFITIRTVKGGAVKLWSDGTIEYLGKSVRWYYAKGEDGQIVYAKSGNKVPRSEGSKPLMQLPDKFPDDVDYDWYIDEAYSILVDIGALTEVDIPEPKTLSRPAVRNKTVEDEADTYTLKAWDPFNPPSPDELDAYYADIFDDTHPHNTSA